MNTKMLLMLIVGFALLLSLLTACASPTQAPPTPNLLAFATSTSLFMPTQDVLLLTASPAAGAVTPNPAMMTPGSSNICADPQSTALIDSLKKAVTSADGILLASLISPTNGMDVAYFHNGRIANYDQQQAKFLFETTYEMKWGADPASGLEKVGPFHEVVVPELVKSFSQPYTLYCNELKYGSASYPVNFPYNKDFYSIYYPGTEANGYLDWHTWVAGIEYVNGKPFLYALTQYYWEP